MLAAFAEELGLTEEQALKLGGCFGGGMCKGEVCGACTGALMALGLKFGQSDIDDMESRKKTNDITVEFLNLFRKENNVSQVLFKRFSKRFVFKKRVTFKNLPIVDF